MYLAQRISGCAGSPLRLGYLVLMLLCYDNAGDERHALGSTEILRSSSMVDPRKSLSCSPVFMRVHTSVVLKVRKFWYDFVSKDFDGFDLMNIGNVEDNVLYSYLS